MTRKERLTRILGGAFALLLLVLCAVYGMRPTPNEAAPTYRAVFGPGGGYFREDGSRVTDPAEERRAWEQTKRLLDAPMVPHDNSFEHLTPAGIRQKAEEYQQRRRR